jgi:hypothetical protein
VKNSGLRHASRKHKLLPKYWGPFKVAVLLGRIAVHLDFLEHLLHIHPVVSITLIKPHVPLPGQLSPVLIGGEEEFELDAATAFNLIKSNRRNVPDEVKFKAQWKGDCEDSWHPTSDFGNAREALIDFLLCLHKINRMKAHRAFDKDSRS